MEPERLGADDPLTASERQFLIDSGLPANSFDLEVMAAARASLRRRADETRREASPELTVLQVACLLGCTAPQVVDAIASQEIYAFETEGELRVPEWQFPDGQQLAGLGPALRELGSAIHPYSVEGLLAEVPHEELDDMTAVAWLAEGRPPEPVVALVAAQSHGM